MDILYMKLNGSNDSLNTVLIKFKHFSTYLSIYLLMKCLLIIYVKLNIYLLINLFSIFNELSKHKIRYFFLIQS